MSDRDSKGRFPPGNGAGRGGEAKGAGWGGPAKGAGAPMLDAGPLGDAVRALAHDPKHAASKAAIREAAFMTWASVMVSSENDGYRIAAADKLMERIDGKATSTTLVGGAEGAAPLVIERRIIDPAGD